METTIIAISNQKGGVGKSTTAYNLGACLALKHDKKVLLIDFDPQANLSEYLKYEPDGNPTMTKLIMSFYAGSPVTAETAQKAIRHSETAGVDYIPADINLANAETLMVTMISKEHILRRILTEDVIGAYDFVLIDCLPSLGTLLINALTAADRVLIPVQTQKFSMDGLQSLEALTQLVKANTNSKLNLIGVLPTMVDRTKVSRTAIETLNEKYGEMLFSAPQTAIQQIPCDQLKPYHNHKFELYSGERLEDMVASIKENGVLSPIIVQPIEDGYEILIGHNRWNASKLAGLPTVPAIVKTGLTEDEAEMYVIESNVMQRGFENLRISEQAAAVALRHSEMFSQGKRNDILRELAVLENPSAEPDTATLNPVGSKLDTSESVGKEYGVSKGSVVRLIRINKLIDELKNLVDSGDIAIRAGVELSFLSDDTQAVVAECAEDSKIDMKKSILICS